MRRRPLAKGGTGGRTTRLASKSITERYPATMMTGSPILERQHSIPVYLLLFLFINSHSLLAGRRLILKNIPMALLSIVDDTRKRGFSFERFPSDMPPSLVCLLGEATCCKREAGIRCTGSFSICVSGHTSLTAS